MSREHRGSRITVVLSDPLKDRVEGLAEENDRSVSDFVRLVLKDYIEALEGQTEDALKT